MAERPHAFTRFFAVIVSATVAGATISSMLSTGVSIAAILLTAAIVALAIVGAAGIIHNEPVLGGLAGLGMLLLIEALPDLAFILFLGAIGLVIAAALAAVEFLIKSRRG